MPTSKTGLFQASRFTLLAIALAMTIAVTTFAGWVFNLEILKTISPVWVSMKVNTALAILISGVSLLLFISGKNRQMAFLFALIVFLTGLASISEYLFNWNAGIEDH